MIRLPDPKPEVLARREQIVAALRRAVPGEGGVISEPLRLKPYETDGLTAYKQPPLAVALPASTEEVAAVMRVCHSMGVRVVPRGAGTSLAGGALPLEDAVVVGLMRMNRVLEVDFDDRLAVVEAGVTNLAITREVESEGFFYAPDPSSQLACMIGGNVNMNSGGAHCLKYGVTANNLLGLRQRQQPAAPVQRTAHRHHRRLQRHAGVGDLADRPLAGLGVAEEAHHPERGDLRGGEGDVEAGLLALHGLARLEDHQGVARLETRLVQRLMKA